jgi:malate synthase
MKELYGKKIPEMSDTQKEYITGNHNRMTIQEMASNLKVSATYISAWLNDLGLSTRKRRGPIKKEAENNRSGFFRHDPKLATI